MSEAYLGEIRMFAGNFPPQNWALCDGSLLSISQYSALYALIGTTYGGDGVNNFNLPDLRGRVPIGQGTGPTLTPRTLGQKFGAETVALTATQIPAHIHALSAGSTAGATVPTNNFPGQMAANVGTLYYKTPTPPPNPPATTGTMAGVAVSGGGQNAAHANIMPSLAVSFIMCVEGGIFPQSY